jgi:hypothetical protein
MAKFDTLVGVITFVVVIGVIYVLYKGFIAYTPGSSKAPTNVTPSSYNAGTVGYSHGSPTLFSRVGETNK